MARRGEGGTPLSEDLLREAGQSACNGTTEATCEVTAEAQAVRRGLWFTWQKDKGGCDQTAMQRDMGRTGMARRLPSAVLPQPFPQAALREPCLHRLLSSESPTESRLQVPRSPA